MAINFNNSNLFNTNSLFNDYSMLKTSGYRNLVKSYYANNKFSTDEDVSVSSMATSMKKTSKNTLTDAEKTNLTDLKTNGKNLNTSAMKLVSASDTSVFAKGDSEAINSSINEFVENYNKTLESLTKSDNKTALQKGVLMTSTTKYNAKMLEKVGISVGKDNRLSIDKNKLEAGDINDKKALFNGYNSYANNIANKASQISYASNSALMYDKNGSMNYTYSSIYSTLM